MFFVVVVLLCILFIFVYFKCFRKFQTTVYGYRIDRPTKGYLLDVAEPYHFDGYYNYLLQTNLLVDSDEYMGTKRFRFRRYERNIPIEYILISDDNYVIRVRIVNLLEYAPNFTTYEHWKFRKSKIEKSLNLNMVYLQSKFIKKNNIKKPLIYGTGDLTSFLE